MTLSRPRIPVSLGDVVLVVVRVPTGLAVDVFVPPGRAPLEPEAVAPAAGVGVAGGEALSIGPAVTAGMVEDAAAVVSETDFADGAQAAIAAAPIVRIAARRVVITWP